MEIEHIKGLLVAPLTPFDKEGRIEPRKVPEYREFLYKNGIKGVFVNGTTGEGLSLSVEERIRMTEAWIKGAPADFKIIVHVGHLSRASFTVLAEHAREQGAFGIGALGNLFFRAGDPRALAKHCAQEARIVPDLPYYYYHIPSLTKIDFPMYPFLKEISEYSPNFAGIKYTFETLMDYSLCKECKGRKYDILFGRDEMLLPSLTLGAEGWIGSTYNVAAPLYLNIIKAFKEGELELAGDLQRKSHQLIQLLLKYGKFIGTLKELMHILFDMDFGGCREPLESLSNEEKEDLKREIDTLEIQPYLNKR